MSHWLLKLYQVFEVNLPEMSFWQVLSQLLADLDACDSQKEDSQGLANGEVTLG